MAGELVYIKFRYVDDVYAIQPGYDLKPEGSGPDIPRICPRCGSTLFIPIQLPEGAYIGQPATPRILPVDHHKYVITTHREPEHYKVLMWPRKSVDTRERLLRYASVLMVDHSWVEMAVEAVSGKPVRHICGQ